MLKYKSINIKIIKQLLLIILLLYNIKSVNAKIIETPDLSYTLDLVGLLITFGDNDAKDRLIHQMYNRDKWIFVATMTPGMYTWLGILNQLFKDFINNKNSEIYNLKMYKYIGISSNTRMIINSIAGENFVEHNIREPIDEKKWNEIKNNRPYRRLTNLRIVKINKNPNSKDIIDQPFIEKSWLIFTILTIFVCVIIGLMEDWFAFSIVACHIICNFMIHVLFLNGNIHWPDTKPSTNSPDGDVIIEIKNSILLIIGKEEEIQKLLQKPIIYKNKINNIYTIGLTWILTLLTLCWTILGSPLSTTQGQYCLGAELIIGLLCNIYISQQNNGDNWNKICERDFDIKEEFCETFESRSIALGVAMIKCNSNPDYLIGNELPNTLEWNQWANIIKKREINDNKILDIKNFIHDAYFSLRYCFNLINDQVENIENEVKETSIIMDENINSLIKIVD
jgi:hypothetical protein